MFVTKEKCSTQSTPYMPLNPSPIGILAMNGGGNGRKLYAPKPIRPIPQIHTLAQKAPKLGFSAMLLPQRLRQLSQHTEEAMTNSQLENSSSVELPECERKASLSTIQSHLEESAFRPLNETHGEERKSSVSSRSNIMNLPIIKETKISKDKEPLKRWNRTDDKHLWKIIRTVAESQNESLEEVLELIINNDQSPYWKMILPTLRNQVESFSESQTLSQVDKKGMKFFTKRVIKLNNMREVSRREHKLIRKLLRANKKNNKIEWEQILFHFPGKRIQELMNYTLENFPKYFQNCLSNDAQDDQ